MGKVKYVMVMCLLLSMSISTAYGKQKITVAGATVLDIGVRAASKEFKKTHPDVTFVIGMGGTAQGIQLLGKGEVMVGLAGRDLLEKELKQFPDLVGIKICMDGIYIIVNKNNPVSKLTKQQVQDMYTGVITNWKDVGGNDEPVITTSLTPALATTDFFLGYFGLECKVTDLHKMKTVPYRKKGSDKEYHEAIMYANAPECLAAIMTKPGTIAYVAAGTAQKIIRKGGALKGVELDGVAATLENIAKKKYIVRRNLTFATKGPATGVVKDFVDFLLSDPGQKLLEEEADLIPLKAVKDKEKK
jgi:phosphate transport system substrate-binding protein